MSVEEEWIKHKGIVFKRWRIGEQVAWTDWEEQAVKDIPWIVMRCLTPQPGAAEDGA